MQYWLMKSEPEEFSIDDLVSMPNRTEHWDGVRNYQARNFMRDKMRIGDQVFFYHSNCAEPGIVGTMTVTRESYPDHTAFDPNDKHFDPKSDPDQPRWFMVDITFKERFVRTVSLKELKDYADSVLQDFVLVRRGNRLSVMPVGEAHWNFILSIV